MEITNIRSSIQNFTNKEKGVRKCDTLGGPQDIIFLSENCCSLKVSRFYTVVLVNYKTVIFPTEKNKCVFNLKIIHYKMI